MYFRATFLSWSEVHLMAIGALTVIVAVILQDSVVYRHLFPAA